jgi:Tfp pilus assembly protein PilF
MQNLRLMLVTVILLTVTALHSRADSYSDSAGPKPPSKLLLTAHELMSKGEWQKALPLLEAFLSGTPDDVMSLADIGLVYDKTGDKEEARRNLNVALSLDPRSLESNLYLGQLELEEGNLEAARKRLAVLDEICIFGCGEYHQLKLDVLAYEESHPK